MTFARNAQSPLTLVRTVLFLARAMKREQVSIVHCITLRSILLGGTAALIAGVRLRIFAVTGEGFLAANRKVTAKFIRVMTRFAITNLIANSRTHFVFENESDPAGYNLSPGAENVTILGGAGVDTEHYREMPLPGGQALKIAVVARMLWSKGIDVAVEGVQIARQQGYDVRLSLYGAPDDANPRTVPRETLETWSMQDGIDWYGPVADVRDVWGNHHLACLLSRGGEGLPRTLLEAASCGRAVLTTDVPGCRDFIRDGQEGWIVPVDAAEPFARILIMLFYNRIMVEEAGKKARQRVSAGFTENKVVQQMQDVYRSMSTE